ncbi:hypothetical protein B0T22DRAFT_469396 [Podospora appendiculata]|uniref:Uncharacterized protein n=1 Tax=Podospora appendiculata TaxID=314037 RepID=A0AAE1C9F3_9PEZI|nr:hypothetical protein B0T22DRAFT_469396 [Podospora appendiculata]
MQHQHQHQHLDGRQWPNPYEFTRCERWHTPGGRTDGSWFVNWRGTAQDQRRTEPAGSRVRRNTANRRVGRVAVQTRIARPLMSLGGLCGCVVAWLAVLAGERRAACCVHLELTRLLYAHAQTSACWERRRHVIQRLLELGVWSGRGEVGCAALCCVALRCVRPPTTDAGSKAGGMDRG